ncbi:hypothetical protein [Nocardia sp. NPDC057353]|uniref:hypothetical protein n=1 Tax=Nocardia sp. NPDC057353 TaxID=3346104 RepID=UPI003629AEE9
MKTRLWIAAVIAGLLCAPSATAAAEPAAGSARDAEFVTNNLGEVKLDFIKKYCVRSKNNYEVFDDWNWPAYALCVLLGGQVKDRRP